MLDTQSNLGWVKQGDALIFADPSAVNSWASKYWDDVLQLNVDIPNIQTTSEPGPNIIVSETRYNGENIFGDTVSWYDANVNCDPTNPDDHICP